jgi:hypothetical protein
MCRKTQRFGLLVVYPDDQRLIKTKSLLESYRVVDRISTRETRFYFLSFAIRSQFATLLTMARVLCLK